MQAAGRNTTMQSNLSLVNSLPGWLPDAVKLYLDHTEDGLSYRALARRDGRHASTVMRAVRRYETRRDDPLLDEALSALVTPIDPAASDFEQENASMSAPIRASGIVASEETILAEGKRILRRLIESGAILAFAQDMERAVVMREFPDGHSSRTAVVDRTVAQAFALKEWIVCRKPGRVATYEISATGRAALRRMVGAEARHGFAEAPSGFDGPRVDWQSQGSEAESAPRRIRYNLAESPVAVLGRRRDKDGKLYLEPELVIAAERLREDFELAQMGPRVTQNWEGFMTGCVKSGHRGDSGKGEGPRGARDRVAAALRDLGPGLGDVALRVCCFLEGIETAETNLGWAARSGKVVLRIALQRLWRHYEEVYGRSGPMIG